MIEVSLDILHHQHDAIHPVLAACARADTGHETIDCVHTIFATFYHMHDIKSR